MGWCPFLFCKEIEFAGKEHTVLELTETCFEENDVERIFTDSTIVVFPYTSTTGSSGVLHQAGSYGKAVIMPDLGDLALLIKDEGYKGEFFNPESADSLAIAIDKIISNDTYRKELAIANFQAASALSMDKIIMMYIECFKSIQ